MEMFRMTRKEHGLLIAAALCFDVLVALFTLFELNKGQQPDPGGLILLVLFNIGLFLFPLFTFGYLKLEEDKK